MDGGAWKEVSDYLGVSRQRVDQLAVMDRLPAPTLTAGVKLWEPTQIEAWVDANWWGTRRWRVRPT